LFVISTLIGAGAGVLTMGTTVLVWGTGTFIQSAMVTPASFDAFVLVITLQAARRLPMA
jgi:hypothetical protein